MSTRPVPPTRLRRQRLALMMLARASQDLATFAWRLRERRSVFLAPHQDAFSRRFILLEYPMRTKPRWDRQRGPHPELHDLLAGRREQYAALLRRFSEVTAPLRSPRDATAPRPRWDNTWFTGLDALALYCMLALERPRRLIEVGSGFSTTFARLAVADHQLPTRITSIDPRPREDIDSLCDNVIRQPLEDVDLAPFKELEAGDVLFIDSSHYCLGNSDVTVFFLEILPRLQPGVIIHLHDIFLPWDYPAEWNERHYSEQYLLATHLLTRGSADNVLLSNAMVCNDAVLRPLAEELRAGVMPPETPIDGLSFWFSVP